MLFRRPGFVFRQHAAVAFPYWKHAGDAGVNGVRFRRIARVGMTPIADLPEESGQRMPQLKPGLNVSCETGGAGDLIGLMRSWA
jgi:hypothetical protein